MFTGLIQDIGTITALDKSGDWTVVIEAQNLPLERVALGASIACSGVCLTVIKIEGKRFTVQMSDETIKLTTAQHWAVGKKLNLETALRMGDELGGHILSGHIDGMAEVIGRCETGDSVTLGFKVPEDFAKFIAAKGSVAIDGVSLTVNGTEGRHFNVNIIAHTQDMTTLSALKPGDTVNFEIDMIARYVERLLRKAA